ncbi:MAG: hypothetical protein RL169_2014 [Armatimonadota bacterium]|jgi:hypothetical protein
MWELDVVMSPEITNARGQTTRTENADIAN